MTYKSCMEFSLKYLRFNKKSICFLGNIGYFKLFKQKSLDHNVKSREKFVYKKVDVVVSFVIGSCHARLERHWFPLGWSVRRVRSDWARFESIQPSRYCCQIGIDSTVYCQSYSKNRKWTLLYCISTEDCCLIGRFWR